MKARKASHQVASYPTLDEEVTCKEVTHWATGTVVRLEGEGLVAKITVPAGTKEVFNEGREYSLTVFEAEDDGDEPNEDPGEMPGVDYSSWRFVDSSPWAEVGR